jgi:hypothetical protein
MPLPPERSLMRMPTQQSKVMKRKAWEAVERERGEDNNGDNDGDDDDNGDAEVAAKMTTSVAHVGGWANVRRHPHHAERCPEACVHTARGRLAETHWTRGQGVRGWQESLLVGRVRRIEPCWEAQVDTRATGRGDAEDSRVGDTREDPHRGGMRAWGGCRGEGGVEGVEGEGMVLNRLAINGGADPRPPRGDDDHHRNDDGVFGAGL